MKKSAKDFVNDQSMPDTIIVLSGRMKQVVAGIYQQFGAWISTSAPEPIGGEHAVYIKKQIHDQALIQAHNDAIEEAAKMYEDKYCSMDVAAEIRALKKG